jgi:hypothetical protein
VIYSTVRPFFTAIRNSHCLSGFPDLEPVINFVELPPTLHTLELGFLDNNRGRLVDASGPNGLISSVIPNLRTLILDYFTISNPDVTERFWRAHPGLERLELNCHDRFECSWFDGFESGMLPNLKYLKVIRYHC